MNYKKIADYVCVISNACIMFAALEAASRGVPVTTQHFLIALTGIIWCASGFVWGHD